jgi:hypothetical protein
MAIKSNVHTATLALVLNGAVNMAIRSLANTKLNVLNVLRPLTSVFSTNTIHGVSMTIENINKTIALACGWETHSTDRWRKPDGTAGLYAPPNYYNDLNAMYEAEATLSGGIEDNKQRTYYQHLREIVVKKMPTMLWDEESYINFHILHATAPQRAEAFIRTIKKWKKS